MQPRMPSLARARGPLPRRPRARFADGPPKPSRVDVLPVKSVGVQGDFRTPVARRPLLRRVLEAFPAGIRSSARPPRYERERRGKPPRPRLWEAPPPAPSPSRGSAQPRLDQTAPPTHRLDSSNARLVIPYLPAPDDNLLRRADGRCSIVLRPSFSRRVTARFAHLDLASFADLGAVAPSASSTRSIRVTTKPPGPSVD
jgi:hypothetical protein